VALGFAPREVPLARVPRPLRDVGYGMLGRVRQRLFSPPDSLCAIVPPALRSRFIG
jgi:predicted DCC family thiol-disulfide oxidoreductase YuxK